MLEGNVLALSDLWSRHVDGWLVGVGSCGAFAEAHFGRHNSRPIRFSLTPTEDKSKSSSNTSSSKSESLGRIVSKYIKIHTQYDLAFCVGGLLEMQFIPAFGDDDDVDGDNNNSNWRSCSHERQFILRDLA